LTAILSTAPMRDDRPGVGLRRLTRLAEGLTLLGVAVGTVFVAYVWSDPERVTRHMSGVLHGLPVAIGGRAWMASGALAVFLLVLFAWAMWEARALFRALGKGDFFAVDVPRRLTRLGYLALAGSVCGIVVRALMEIVSRIGVSPRPSQFSVEITSADYVSVIAALLLIAFAKVMHEARRIADENRGFV
jgi:Protein of unknown function (DUF2975)